MLSATNNMLSATDEVEFATKNMLSAANNMFAATDEI